MTGIELYAERKRRHRRTWTLAAIVLGAVFMVGGQIGALLPAIAAGFVARDGADLLGSVRLWSITVGGEPA